MINAVWGVSFVLELALVVRLIRWRVRLPAFRAYLCFDLFRTVLMWCVDNGSQSSAVYEFAWRVAEPVAVVLLAIVGAEAWRHLVNSSIRYAEVWAGVGVGPVVVGIAAAGANLHVLMTVHAFITGLIAAGLCISLTGRFRAHATILMLFCAVDFIGYAAALISRVSSGCPVYDSRVAAAIILGETACVAGWLWHAKHLGPTEGLAPVRP